MTRPELKTAVVAGASGYLGQHLVRTLASRGTDVRTIGRSAASDATWSDPASLVAALRLAARMAETPSR